GGRPDGTSDASSEPQCDAICEVANSRPARSRSGTSRPSNRGASFGSFAFTSPRAISSSTNVNSCATCRLNSMLWERCLAMAFILRKPSSPCQITKLNLSGPRGALQTGEIEHSGIVVEAGKVGDLFGPRVVSKWGPCQEFIHF